MTTATTMTTVPTAAFMVHAIPAETLDRIRDDGHDDFGNKLEVVVDEDGGAPLRCCLRPAARGARMNLIAYRPFTRPGPYAEVGPVFVHADACAGYTDTGSYPQDYRDWPTMVFRPYRYDGRIAYDAIAMGDGVSAEQVIADIFADRTVEFIHTRNVYAGCFMFAITRPVPS